MSEKNNDIHAALEAIYQRQKTNKTEFHICPRCGINALDEQIHHNALSRRATVYVCNACGMDEAVRDYKGFPLPVEQWAFAKELQASKNKAEIVVEVRGGMVVNIYGKGNVENIDVSVVDLDRPTYTTAEEDAAFDAVEEEIEKYSSDPDWKALY